MKKTLVFALFLCFFFSSAFAAVKSVSSVPEKEDEVQAAKPIPSSPATARPAGMTDTKVPATSPIKPASPTVPTLSTKSRTSPILKPGISTMIIPVQATQPAQPPIIESISFDGYDSTGNLKWQVGIHNNHSTEYPGPLWVGTRQCQIIQAGPVCHSAGPTTLVLTRPLAPGQKTQVSGSFARLAEMTQLKVRLTNGPTTLQLMESQLPPELTYQAQVVGINMTTDAVRPLQISIRNTGANAIPSMSVNKLCAHSAAPNTFSPCGGRALNTLLLNQTVNSDHEIPPGWPVNPNIIKVRISRGANMFDEELYYPQ